MKRPTIRPAWGYVIHVLTRLFHSGAASWASLTITGSLLLGLFQSIPKCIWFILNHQKYRLNREKLRLLNFLKKLLSIYLSSSNSGLLFSGVQSLVWETELFKVCYWKNAVEYCQTTQDTAAKKQLKKCLIRPKEKLSWQFIKLFKGQSLSRD